VHLAVQVTRELIEAHGRYRSVPHDCPVFHALLPLTTRKWHIGANGEIYQPGSSEEFHPVAGQSQYDRMLSGDCESFTLIYDLPQSEIKCLTN
jgi:hypothetical protein